jgi:hypothetical protein
MKRTCGLAAGKFHGRMMCAHCADDTLLLPLAIEQNEALNSKTVRSVSCEYCTAGLKINMSPTSRLSNFFSLPKYGVGS